MPMASLNYNYNCAKVDIIEADRTQATAFFGFCLSPTLSEHCIDYYSYPLHSLSEVQEYACCIHTTLLMNRTLPNISPIN